MREAVENNQTKIVLKGEIMPIKKVKGGWKWGNHGKTYPTKKQAIQQMKAAFAAGYKEGDIENLVLPKES